MVPLILWLGFSLASCELPYSDGSFIVRTCALEPPAGGLWVLGDEEYAALRKKAARGDELAELLVEEEEEEGGAVDYTWAWVSAAVLVGGIAGALGAEHIW